MDENACNSCMFWEFEDFVMRTDGVHDMVGFCKISGELVDHDFTCPYYKCFFEGIFDRKGLRNPITGKIIEK